MTSVYPAQMHRGHAHGLYVFHLLELGDMEDRRREATMRPRRRQAEEEHVNAAMPYPQEVPLFMPVTRGRICNSVIQAAAPTAVTARDDSRLNGDSFRLHLKPLLL